MRAARLLVASLLLSWCCWAACDEPGLRIPRLLHRNFMAGAKALRAATQDPVSGFKAHWLDSCKVRGRLAQACSSSGVARAAAAAAGVQLLRMRAAAARRCCCIRP